MQVISRNKIEIPDFWKTIYYTAYGLLHYRFQVRINCQNFSVKKRNATAPPKSGQVMEIERIFFEFTPRWKEIERKFTAENIIKEIMKAVEI